VDRIKRLSMEVLDQHKDKFTISFADNKKLLDQLAVIRSKGLKNEMAGYITKLIKRERDTIESKESDVEEEEIEAEIEAVEETQEAEVPQEITIESSEEAN
jgi:small subunit ribosomal protein S17e